ncbi:hypothetical protein HY26_17135 [Hyphomonas sp. GM-8P]|nr:hypothetical protein HY26_17135 [Hyphomonas sp. GM-8P]
MIAKFGMTTMFRTGSFGNGTNISGFSDVDYFCVIPRDKLSNDSSSTLASVASAMRARFSTTSGIRVNGPAVRLPFGLDGAEATELVPVDYTGQTLLDFRKFDMPDGNGSWMFSAPESHNAYVTNRDKKMVGELKPLIRFVKAWKYFRSVPVSSFYLEMFVAKYAHSEETIVNHIDLARIFRALADSSLGAIIDPRFPSDGRYLYAANTNAQLSSAIDAVRLAATRAEQASAYQLKDQTRNAFERYGVLYNGAFPIYSGF